MHASYEEPWMLCALQERREKIRRVVATCPRMERRILELTYGLTDQQEYTIEEVGKILGRARENVRSIQAHAIDRISRTHRREWLLPFVQE